jgi:uncharacterized Zn-finger protein
VCEVCDFSFTQKGDLIRHKKIHTDKKPHLSNIYNGGLNHFFEMKPHKKNQIHKNSKK